MLRVLLFRLQVCQENLYARVVLLEAACMEYLEDRTGKVRPNTLDGYRSSATEHTNIDTSYEHYLRRTDALAVGIAVRASG